MPRRQRTAVQNSRQIEEASVDSRRGYSFGFALGFSVRQAWRHFLAVQEKSGWMAQERRLPYNVNGEGGGKLET